MPYQPIIEHYDDGAPIQDDNGVTPNPKAQAYKDASRDYKRMLRKEYYDEDNPRGANSLYYILKVKHPDDGDHPRAQPTEALRQRVDLAPCTAADAATLCVRTSSWVVGLIRGLSVLSYSNFGISSFQLCSTRLFSSQTHSLPLPGGGDQLSPPKSSPTSLALNIFLALRGNCSGRPSTKK